MASVYDETSLKKAQEEAQKAVQKQTALNLKGVSDATKAQLQNYQTYNPSQAVNAAQQTFQATQAAKPQDYVSAYDDQIKAAYDQIMNRPKFQYDLNGDMLYQQYKDQYVNQGRRAMMDTMGNAAALTGGYGSSYASTAGNLAYQNYLQQLNAAIPELYDRAANQYALDGENLMNQYNMALGADEQAYGRWQDAYNRWGQELAAAENTYNTERGFDYGQYQDALAYWQSIAGQESNDYWNAYSNAYNMAMAMLQAGQTLSPELMYAAGLTEADVATLAAMYAPKKSGGGGRTKTRDLTTDDYLALTKAAQSDVSKNDGGYSTTNKVVDDLIKSGVNSDAAKKAADLMAKAQEDKKTAQSGTGKTVKEREYNYSSYGW